MKVLFVYGNMYSLGGIQTWLIRVARKLDAEGHSVALLTRSPTEPWDSTSAFVDELANYATVHVGGRHWFTGPAAHPSLGRPQVIFACGLEALLLAVHVQKRMLPEAKIVAGTFAPREYCWKAPRRQRRWSQHLAERIIQRLPIENFMFSTDGMARQTGDCLGRDLTASRVLPLPIDTDRLQPVPGRRIDLNKIASVARLVPYYTHHRQMIRVIAELRAEGHAFAYHAYGDGPDRSALEMEARRFGVEDAIFLHGAIPYEDFPEAVGDAFAYIGLGTALIEAAACGIPSLVAIDSHAGPMTYGFVQDTTGNDIGGYVPGHVEHPIAERLLWLASRTEEEYRQVERRSRARAEEFSLNRLIPRLVDILSGAKPFSPPISPLDRVLGKADWLLEAVLLKLGAPDAMSARHLRLRA